MDTTPISQKNRQDFAHRLSETTTSHPIATTKFDSILAKNNAAENPEHISLAKIADRLTTSILGITDVQAEKHGDGILGMDDDGVPIFDDKHPDYHHYITSNACSKKESWCNYDAAVQGLLRYPAPGATGEPIQDEQTGFAVPVGYVRHEVYDNGARIYNITQEGKHLLDPGIVKRWVDESQYSININTFGEGTGNMGNLNNWLSDPLWEKVDSDIFNYMRIQSGSH